MFVVPAFILGVALAYGVIGYDVSNGAKFTPEWCYGVAAIYAGVVAVLSLILALLT